MKKRTGKELAALMLACGKDKTKVIETLRSFSEQEIERFVKAMAPTVERLILKGEPFLICMMNDIIREEQRNGFVQIGEPADNVVKFPKQARR